jgi:protein tyrosine phosphatase (PTP) superfamily phosphohydrolase (DUF442 family)
MGTYRVAQLVLLVGISALALSAGTVNARTEATASGKPIARAVPEAGIIRFAEIRPGLARGGEPGTEGLRYLQRKGYRTIVSFLTDPAESAWVVQSGMRYVHLPMRSSFFFADTPTDEQVKQFLSVASDSTLYPMYIHCHAGKDRTGAMTAIYRMEVCGWSADEAVEEMKAFGFSGRYDKLMRYVENYSVHPSASPLPQTATALESAPAVPASAETP